jgi:plastin-1
MSEASKLPRAEKMLAQAAKINCNKLITASQVVAGNPRLNLAFVANVFNTSPGE